jgi:hypothetical protein
MSIVDAAWQLHESIGRGDISILPQYVDTSQMPEVIDGRRALVRCMPAWS